MYVFCLFIFFLLILSTMVYAIKNKRLNGKLILFGSWFYPLCLEQAKYSHICGRQEKHTCQILNYWQSAPNLLFYILFFDAGAHCKPHSTTTAGWFPVRLWQEAAIEEWKKGLAPFSFSVGLPVYFLFLWAASQQPDISNSLKAPESDLHFFSNLQN